MVKSKRPNVYQMENEEIKQNLIFLYTEFQNPALLNAKELSDSILEIYSSPSSIPILFDILVNSENHNFKLQASIGLKLSLISCSSQLDQSTYSEIWENFFDIILNENADLNIDILIPPIIEIFKLSQYDWSVVEEFIDLLSKKDQIKCLQIVTSLLPFLDPNFIISRFEDFTNMVITSTQSEDNLLLFKYTYLLFFILANCVVIDHCEIYDNLLNLVSKPFSEILILLLENEKLFQESIISIIDSLEIRINPFLLELLFDPILECLQYSTISISFKYCIILLFQNLLSCDSSFEIDTETLHELIASSVPLSLELFDQSDDIEYPDSYIFSNFYYQCLNRIPIENLEEVVHSLLDSFSDAENPSELYNLLIFYNACLYRSNFLFVDAYPQIITVLTDCLQTDHSGLRNEAAFVFCSQKVLIESIEKDQIYELISMIIEILSSQDFYYGFAFIKVLVDLIDDSDPIFDITFSMCNQIIKENSDIDSSLTEISWEILNNLIKRSKKSVYSVFENLYSISNSIIKSYDSEDNEKDQIFVCSAINCLSSLSKSCRDLIIEQIDEIFPLLVDLIENSEDLKIIKSVLKCIKSFVSKMPDIVEDYVYNFFKNTFLEIFSNKSIKVLLNADLQRGYSNYFLTPSINFLTKIVKNYPHFFNDNEMVVYLFKVFEIGINQYFEDSIIASLHLFKKIMIFMKIANLIEINIVKPFILLIINKMKRDISQDVIGSMFSVINESISIFGNSIILKREVPLFEFVLSSVDHNINQFTKEIEYNNVYNIKAFQLLGNIIKCFYENEDNDFEDFNDQLVNNFIPRIMQLLNDPNPNFINLSLNLFSQIAISTNDLLSSEIIDDIIQKSFVNIENINGHTISTILFLDSLVYNYNQVLDSLISQLVELIEGQISTLDLSKEDEKCISEYFITLLTILDTHSENLIDESRMKMILSNLPILFSKNFNNKHIYLFLLRHYDDFPEFQLEILKNIVIVFESASSIIESRLPEEIVTSLLALIIQTGIPDNQKELNVIFDNQIDEIQSFLLTISFLSQHINET